jgi:ligand-binding SRPBCC domain-containing protein
MAGEYVLERVQRVSASLQETFDFFSDPRNLARITPPWLAFQLSTFEPAAGRPGGGDLEMHEGLRLHYRIRPLLVPQRWTSIISTWDPPHRFVDEQLHGPYRRWHHTHEFRAEGGGTEIRDVVSYALPFGPLGTLAHALFVRRQLESIFAFRFRVIDEILRERKTHDE